MRRSLQLLVGLVLYAVSIATLVRAGLGNMPWDVLSEGLSERLGWTFGTVTVAVSGVVLLCWIPLRQRPGIGTVANVLVIGVLVDPFLAVLALLPQPLPVAAAIAMTVAGIGLNGLATACYIGTRLGPGPRDGLMTGVVARTDWPVRLVRSGIEVLVVAAGWLLGGTVGLGTLAYALGIGPVVHALMPRFLMAPRGTTPPQGGAPSTSVEAAPA
ncbi:MULTISPECIES: YitT family protein [unclassified Actinotalea]|uniref:membrane protein YczE n=1 Tax=unclassified Actinotalea TaxID=2638618 RepID=UPI0015F64F4B|nr:MULTISPECIES: hypothetical protein [unclassified Actinotalea]